MSSLSALRRLHLYLGCLFAPALTFFALTGIVQVFRLHEDAKDGSYHAPAWLKILGMVHKSQVVKRAAYGLPMQIFTTAMALSLVVTMIIGVILAYRFGRSAAWVTAALVFGALGPALLLLAFR